MTKEKELHTDIILVDIIGFSKLTSDQQLELITFLTRSYKKMINKMISNSNLSIKKMLLGFISTGDGFYCILNSKLKGFGVIMALGFNHFSEMVPEKFPYFEGIRVAVHTGSMYEFKDILGNVNYVGDGLNDCSRYLEYKAYAISTIMVSKEAYESFEIFLDIYKDYIELLHERGFKRSVLYDFKDKHSIKREGYLVWLRKGGVINPPNNTFNSLKM